MDSLHNMSVEAGLDAERDLLDRVHAGTVDCQLLFWRPRDQALVMPRRLSRLPGFAAAEAHCLSLGWPIALRDTGGEPVPQSPAVLNVALAYVLPRDENPQARLETAYLRLCDPLREWLRAQGLAPALGEVPGAFCDGRYNVTLEQRKLVGTAQRWRRRPSDGRHLVLAHGAVLMENQRQVMVELVNAFYEHCGLDERCLADSHIALDECLGDVWSRCASLAQGYRVALQASGLQPSVD